MVRRTACLIAVVCLAACGDAAPTAPQDISVTPASACANWCNPANGCPTGDFTSTDACRQSCVDQQEGRFCATAARDFYECRLSFPGCGGEAECGANVTDNPFNFACVAPRLEVCESFICPPGSAPQTIEVCANYGLCPTPFRIFFCDDTCITVQTRIDCYAGVDCVVEEPAPMTP